MYDYLDKRIATDQGNITIYGNGGMITRAGMAGAFRLFSIQGGGALNLLNITLDHGLSQGANGANGNIAVSGIINQQASQNGATGGSGGCGGFSCSIGTGGSGGTVNEELPNNYGSTNNFGSNGQGSTGGFGGGGGGGAGAFTAAHDDGVSGLGGLGGFGGGNGGSGGNDFSGSFNQVGDGGGGGGGGGFGGAVFVATGGALTTSGVTFSNNRAIGGNGGNGGTDGVGFDNPRFPVYEPLSGSAGNGGDARGGAVFNNGNFCSTSTTYVGNSVTGGLGGTAISVGNIITGPGIGNPGANGGAYGPDVNGGAALTCLQPKVSPANVSATHSANSQSLNLLAIFSAAAPSRITFTVYNSSGNQVGTSVSDTGLGSIKTTYTLPAGTAAGTYKIHAILTPLLPVLSSAVGFATLTVK